MIPIHLEGYDILRALTDWQTITASRKWKLQSWDHGMVRCELYWECNETEYRIKETFATSGQEAVYLAIDYFERWERLQVAGDIPFDGTYPLPAERTLRLASPPAPGTGDPT